MDTITVRENGADLTFGWEDLLRYHGGGFPGGVVHGLKAMQAAFRLLSDDPPERREIVVATAFTGPGGRDAIEHVTRALTDGRLTVDRSLGGAHPIDDPPGPYLFRFAYRGRRVEATVLPGHVRADFIALGAKPDRSPDEEARLTALKAEMAQRLLPLPADAVYAARLLPPATG
ncbi:hypothetical protein [Salinarimonas sp.]|uniref:hypothetical protein n=1 Tax=Salinarimonas sp. TaxID=2766526 RepID=UPI0035B52EDA